MKYFTNWIYKQRLRHVLLAIYFVSTPRITYAQADDRFKNNIPKLLTPHYSLNMSSSILPSLADLVQIPPVTMPYSVSLWQVLDKFGFADQTQKDALLFLLQKAGIADVDELLNQILHNPDDILRSMIKLVDLTQQHFTMREGDKERWETSAAAWMFGDKERLLKAVTSLKLVEEVKPQFSDPDVVCILGGRKTFAFERMHHVGKLLDSGELKTKQVVALGGVRRVTINPHIDGSQEDLDKLARRLGKLTKDLTETDVVIQAMDEQSSTKLKSLKISFIDAQAENLRPTTETTLMAFCDWLEQNPDVKSVIFVSNQPYTGYQTAVITEILALRGVKIKFCVIGSKIELTPESPIKVHNLIGELGTQIWARLPLAIEESGLKTNNPEIINKIKELYKKLPNISKHCMDQLTTGDYKPVTKLRKA